MQFINSIFLIGLLAIAIPIIIHLLKSKKVKKLWLGSLRFLIEAQKAKRHKKNLRERLLLLLRSLIIIALIFLFLRPFIGTKQDYGKAESATVILIDVSGSMSGNYNGNSMLSAAKEKTKQLISELESSTHITIACFADNIIEIKDLKDLNTIQGTGTDYEKAIKWAQNRLTSSKKKSMNIIMITDMQVSGLPSDVVSGWSNLIDFHLYPILPSGKNNTGINTVIIPEVSTGKTTRLHPEFETIGDENTNGTLQLYINGKKESSTEQNSKEGLIWKPTKTGWHEGKVVLENNDPWEFDNSFYFKTYVNTLKSVLIVNGNKGKSRFTDASYFVKNAYEVNEDASNKAINTNLKNNFSVTNEDLAVLCDVSGFSSNETEAYKTYIEKGGTALFFLGSQTDENKLNSLFDDAIFPVKIERLSEKTIRPVSNWDLDHNALKLFNNHNAGDVTTIVFNEAFKLTPHPKATVLARLNNDNPAIVEIEYGKGKVIVIANPANRDWTDWAVSRMFLPLVRELSYYLIGTSENQKEETFTTCSIIKNPTPGIIGDNKLVVNHDTKESLTEVTGKTQFLSALGIQQADSDIIEETAHKATLSKDRQRENELWYIFALLIIILLLAESFTSYNLK